MPDAAGRVRRALDIALRAANDPASLAPTSKDMTVSKKVSRQEGISDSTSAHIKQDDPEQKAGGDVPVPDDDNDEDEIEDEDD